jgi:hypothetical protein
MSVAVCVSGKGWLFFSILQQTSVKKYRSLAVALDYVHLIWEISGIYCKNEKNLNN